MSSCQAGLSRPSNGCGPDPVAGCDVLYASAVDYAEGAQEKVLESANRRCLQSPMVIRLQAANNTE